MGLLVVYYVTKVWLKLLVAEVQEGFKDISCCSIHAPQEPTAM